MSTKKGELVTIDQPAQSQTVATTGPADLIRIAVEQNMDVEKLSKLMDLQERWEATEARKQYFDAFANFQALTPIIRKTSAGHNCKYAALGDIAQQIRPVLEQCQLSYRFDIQDLGEIISVTCIVSHRAGHQEKTTITASADTSGAKNAIQARGSAVTYLQRYSLIGALGLTTADEDIDGRLSSQTITDGQAASIKARLEYTGSNVQKFCHLLGIPNVDAMPASKYAQADKVLTQKETKIAQETTNASA
jgi:hypothetical protein